MREVSVSQDEVLAGYDVLADIYGHVPPLIMWRAWEVAGYRKYRLPEPVLDVGCGDGRFALGVASFAANVEGLDPDEKGIAAAKKAARKAGARNVRFGVGAAQRLPHPDGAFDVVILSWTL